MVGCFCMGCWTPDDSLCLAPAFSARPDFEALREPGKLTPLSPIRQSPDSRPYPMMLLIRPAAEVAIKSKPVRRQQMRQLRQNIRKLLIRLGPDIVVEGSWDRVNVEVPEGRGLLSLVLDELGRIPGISTIQEISVYPLQDLEDVAEKALQAFGDRLTGKTFAVRAKRSGQHDFTSSELERKVGGFLLAKSEAAGVRLKDPDVEVRID